LLRGGAVPAGTLICRVLLNTLARNSPARSMRALVKNNENYKPGSFRVQTQGRAPRAAANNNEYQAENNGGD
jgi:hypothetical protein